MPLKKLLLKPGVNRENTRYTTEGGWYACDKVRFRQGTPEKIGGWQRVSSDTYQGVARALWPWATSGGVPYIGVGTHLKYYVQYGGVYYDITPIYSTATLTNPFTTTNGSPVVTVTQTSHGLTTNTFVIFNASYTVGGVTISGEYQITVVDANTYAITVSNNATSSTTGGGSVSVSALVPAGSDIQVPISGWGAGAWGAGPWGIGGSGVVTLGLWVHGNFGEDLIFAPRGGALYYWDSSAGLVTRGVPITGMVGASDVPTKVNYVAVSDTSRFVLAFGCTDYGSTALDPMLIRWSDQESAVNWTPDANNQAGSVRLSHGSSIQGIQQVRQEILVWTDTSLYSLQYLGPPAVWGTTLLADNVSIVDDRAATVAAGVTYWMGEGKFYMYDGRVQTLPCDVRHYVFSDFNPYQNQQVFASTVEEFNEVWWFYCSANSTTVDRYVVYNYLERIWYYGTMARTAWIDAGVAESYPIAATYNNNLCFHEYGVDDNSTSVTVPIESYIASSEFDIDDGQHFGFIWRLLPDLTFRGSTATAPRVTMTLLPLQNSGSGYNNPASVAGANNASVVGGVTVPIEEFTGQAYVRVRGRQMSMRVDSTELGVQWQLGAPRIDIRQDGRK